MSQAQGTFLKVGIGINLLLLITVRVVYPELFWLTVTLGVTLIAGLTWLAVLNEKALRSRSAAFGLNSLVTVVLVFGIVGVINFLSSRYPAKLDLTKNKLHTLSDQTIKVVKGLSVPVKATFYVTAQEREQHRALFDNYQRLSTKFELEIVDPVREPTRVKRAGIKKNGTLVLSFGTHENKIEDVTEEKLTNALIKILKDKSPVFCAITGHGEKDFSSHEAEGFDAAKKALSDQSYEVKTVNLGQEGKVPETCDAIAIMGPTKSFFAGEIKALQDYFEKGGRGVIALDLNLQGKGDYAPELLAFLESWHVKAIPSLVVDPVSRLLQLDPSVALLATYSKDNPISKDFQANCAFPFARPLEILPGSPADLHLQWIAKSTPKSLEVKDLKIQGEIRVDSSKSRPGPFDVAVAIEGKKKDSKATKNARIVVFGSSHFAGNNFGRFGGNLDFFMNSVSWTMEDESLISIRKKEDEAGRVELTAKSGNFIGLLTVLIVPALTGLAGIGVWMRRRKL